MADKAKVLVVDDSPTMVEMLKMNLSLMEDVQVIATASNGVEALDQIRKHQPDIMLLDLIMPVRDGVAVLEELSSMSGPKPEVIVLSAMASEEVVQRAMAYGVRYFMVKPFDLESLCRKVREVLKWPSQPHALMYPFPGNVLNRSLDEEIAGVFLSIGIPAHIKGYQFLREAVKMVMEEPTLINSITKELYPGIANRFDTTSSKVERAIRHAIEVAWTRGRIENINKIFGCTVYTVHDKPTNGEFIALLADKMKMERSA